MRENLFDFLVERGYLLNCVWTPVIEEIQMIRSLSLITHTRYSNYKTLQALRVISTNENSPSVLVISECLITQIGDEN